MKNLTNKIRILALGILISSTFAVSSAHAVGIAIGAERNLSDKVFNTSMPEHIFIGGDIFTNYYDRAFIKYNYGAKVTLGYKYANAQIFGLAGVQISEFNNATSDEFDDHASPMYGFGVGYNFPSTNFGIRLNKTYYSLDRTGGGEEDISFTDLMFVLVF